MAGRRVSVEIVGDTRNLERSFRRASGSAREFDRNLSRSTRGVLSATIGIRGLTRALAFSSTSFLGGVGIGFALKSTIQAAEESQRVLAQTRQAVVRSGQSWKQYGRQIREATLAQAKLSGFSTSSLLAGFSAFEIRTRNVVQALKLNALAANVARGRNIAFAAAQTLVLKASLGQAGAFRRLGFDVKKHASAFTLLTFLQRKYGQAAAATGRTAVGAQDRFRVALEETQAALGTKALPTLTLYLNRATEWLNNSENQKRVQQEVASALSTTVSVVRDLTNGIKLASDAVGGFKNLLEGLIALKVASTVARWATTFALLRGALGGGAAGGGAAEGLVSGAAIGRLTVLGTATKKFAGVAEVATRKAVLLRVALLALRRIGPIAFVLTLSEIVINRKAIDKKVSNFLREHLGGIAAQQFSSVDALKQEIALRKKLGDSVELEERLLKRVLAIQSKIPASIVRRPPDVLDAADAARRAGGSFFNLPPPKRRGITAAQRNQFFDDALSRALNRVQDISQPKAALARLAELSGLITAQIARVHDITRKLTLRDRLLEVQRQAKELRKQLAADFLDALQLGFEKAQVTAGFADDLARLNAIQAQLLKQIAAEGKTTDLQRQLFQVQQQRADVLKQQREAAIARRNARQFRVLGLGPGGEDLIPGVKSLRASLGSISAAVKGTFLDTGKTRSLLASIRKILSGSLGAISNDVRAKIKEMLDALDQQLKDHEGDRATKFRKANLNKILAGLGLTPEQIRALRARLSQVGAGGTVSGGGGGAFGVALPAGAQIVIPITLEMDGHKVAQITTRHNQKRQRRNPQQKRGR